MRTIDRLHWARTDLAEFAKHVRSSLVEDYRMDASYRRFSGESFPRLRAAGSSAMATLAGLRCALFGHTKLRSDGWAGPESGGDHISCEGCGKVLVDVIYY